MKILKKNIVKLNSPEKVYDLSVPELENFCLKNGVVVHNSHTVPAGTALMDLRISRLDDGILLHADFSQMEVRILAKMSNDKNLLDAFLQKGLDIHRTIASQVFKKKPEDISSNERSFAKFCVFGILYGKSVYNFAQEYLKGDLKYAQEIFDSLFKAYPGILLYIKESHLSVLTNRRVKTIFGDELEIGMPEVALSLSMEDKLRLMENPYSDDIVFSHNKMDDKKIKMNIGKSLRESQNFRIQCVKKSTKIPLLDGTDICIEDLIGKEFYAYSYDLKTEKVVPVKIDKVWKSGEVNKLIKITLDNNEIVETTPEHLYMMRDGSYIECCNLKIGDSLMPFNIFNKNKYNHIVHPYIKSKFGHISKEESIHSLVCRNINLKKTEGFFKCKRPNIHHINKIEVDNRPENLIQCSPSEHGLFHKEERSVYMAEKNKIRKEKFPKWYNNQKTSVRRIINDRLNTSGNICGISSDEFSKVLVNNWKNNNQSRKDALKMGHNSEKAIKNHSRASIKREKNKDYVINRILNQLTQYHIRNLDWRDEEIWNSNRCNLGINAYVQRSSSYIKKHFSWEEFTEICCKKLESFNHKIINIEVINYETPIEVYDMEVPDYHNFAISSGIFIHNSSASSIAAESIYGLVKYLKESNNSTKCFCFTHDSLDLDLQIKNLPLVIRTLKKEVIEMPYIKYGVPAEMDYCIGISGNKLIDLEDCTVSDDLKTITSKFSGEKESLNLLIDKFRKYNVSVEFNIESEKEKKVSLKELFVMKGKYDLFKNTYTYIEGSIILKF